MKYKRIIAAAAALLLCATYPASDWAETIASGESTEFSVADVVSLSRYLMMQGGKPDFNADLNGDGKVNVLDLILLKQRFHQSAVPAVRINEVCASNKASLLDGAGNASDWVELYNPAAQEVSLAGWGLADGKKNLFQFTFPEDAGIPAGGYLLVFCDDGLVQAEGEYHAPFKISASGETIYLTRPSGEIADTLAVPASETDVTYGRIPNGSEMLGFLTPTPGADNSNAPEPAAVPVFSQESGFYDTGFDLTLSGGDEIYYTLDGTDPTVSSTALRYEEGITIRNNTYDQNSLSAQREISLDNYSPPSGYVEKGMVVRAAVKGADGTFGKVLTKSYFVGKDAAYYRDMKVISLTTDPDGLFNSQTGIYVIGDRYYEWRESPEYKKLDNWDLGNPTNYNQSGREWERPAAVEVFEDGAPVYTDNVGIRIAGNATRVNFQKSIRLYARSEYGDSKMRYSFFEGLSDVNGTPIEKFDKVTLRNGGNDIQYTRFRDDLIQELTKDRAFSTQAAENAIVFIDGEFWGFYVLKERMDDDYLASHYNVDKNNVTIIKNGETEGDAALGESFKELYNFAVQSDMSDDANYQKICDAVDMQSFMDYFAVETYINNYDFSNPDWCNNWQLWRVNTPVGGNSYGDGKWRFMLFDTEYSSGLYNDMHTAANYDMLNNMHRKDNWGNLANIFYALMDNARFRQDFEAVYKEIVQTNFAYDRVNAQIQVYVAEQEQAVKDTNSRFYGYMANMINNQYQSYVQDLQNFYLYRPDYALRYLEDLMEKYQ